MTETKRDSLNVRLAKWAGWRVEQVQERGYTDFLNVWSPDGRQRGLSDNGHWSDRIHQSYLDKVIPDYAGSLDAGMALLAGRDVLVVLQPDQPQTATIRDTSKAFVIGAPIVDYVASETDEIFEGRRRD